MITHPTRGEVSCLCDVCEAPFEATYDSRNFGELITELKSDRWRLFFQDRWYHFCPDCVESASETVRAADPFGALSGRALSEHLVALAEGDVVE